MQVRPIIGARLFGPRPQRPKLEIRISKYETSTNHQSSNVQNAWAFGSCLRFRSFEIRVCFELRISCLGFVRPELMIPTDSLLRSRSQPDPIHPNHPALACSDRDPAGASVSAASVRLCVLPDTADPGQVRHRRSGRLPAALQTQMVCG